MRNSILALASLLLTVSPALAAADLPRDFNLDSGSNGAAMLHINNVGSWVEVTDAQLQAVRKQWGRVLYKHRNAWSSGANDGSLKTHSLLALAQERSQGRARNQAAVAKQAVRLFKQAGLKLSYQNDRGGGASLRAVRSLRR